MKYKYAILSLVITIVCIIIIAGIRTGETIEDNANDTDSQSIVVSTDFVESTESKLNTQNTDTTTLLSSQCSDYIVDTYESDLEIKTYKSYIDRIESALDPDMDLVLREVCIEKNFPYEVALALIYTESGFDPYAVNPYSGCYGYCQLHPLYCPENLPPSDNIRYGISLMKDKLVQYNGDMHAALTSYAYGYDSGDRNYANAVMSKAIEYGYKG